MKRKIIGIIVGVSILGSCALGVYLGLQINGAKIDIKGLNTPQILKEEQQEDTMPTCLQKSESWQNGSVKTRVEFQDEKKGDCVVENFWDNGAMKRRVIIKNNEPKKDTFYNYEGILSCETIFLENNQSEKTCYLFGNPTIYVSQTPYTNGLKNGTSYEYYESGKIRKRETYLNGVKEGTTLFFDEEGRVIKKIEYDNGIGKVFVGDFLDLDYVSPRKAIETMENAKKERKKQQDDEEKSPLPTIQQEDNTHSTTETPNPQ